MRKIPARKRTLPGAALPALFAGLLLYGCTTENTLGPVGGTRDQTAETVADEQGRDVHCPAVTVRSGAAAWQISDGNRPTDLRYQGTLGQLARECAVLGETMTMRVGVEGRVIVGPKGGPGNVEVPLRLALVAEGPEPKPIWSKFYSVQVAVPPNTTQVQFSQVEDDLTFALPEDRRIDNYIVYVGFDPQGATTARSGRRTPRQPARTAAPPTAKAPPSRPAPAQRQPQPEEPRQQPAQQTPPPQPQPQQPQFDPPPVFAPPPGHSG